MKNKWIISLLIGLILPIVLVGFMIIFSQVMMQMGEVWAEEAMEISLIEQFLLSFSSFIRENFILLSISTAVSCFIAAVIILLSGDNKKKKQL